MPRRRAPRRRRRKPYNAYPSRTATYGAAGRQLWKDVKWLKSVVNVEQKFYDNAATNSVTETFGQYNFNNVPQGDGASQRDGGSIKIIRGIVTGYIDYNAAGNSSQTVRILVIRRINTAGAAGVTMNDIFQGAPTGAGAVTAFYNKLSLKGYQIMCDKKITVTAEYPRKYFKCYLKGGWHTRFTSSTGAITDVSENICELITVGDQTVSNYPSIFHNKRIIYTDN